MTGPGHDSTTEECSNYQDCLHIGQPPSNCSRQQPSAPAFESALSLLSSRPVAPAAQDGNVVETSSTGAATGSRSSGCLDTVKGSVIAQFERGEASDHCAHYYPTRPENLPAKQQLKPSPAVLSTIQHSAAPSSSVSEQSEAQHGRASRCEEFSASCVQRLHHCGPHGSGRQPTSSQGRSNSAPAASSTQGCGLVPTSIGLYSSQPNLQSTVMSLRPSQQPQAQQSYSLPAPHERRPMPQVRLFTRIPSH